jgi:uncharacterized protein YbaP (TraB family)
MKYFRTPVSLIALCIGLAAAPMAMAQTLTPAAQDEHVDTVDEVVVVARRAGAPMWEVSSGESTVILVGAIGGVPRDFEWRPEALEAATSRSQRILYPQEGRASISDVLRLIWRIRSIARLPEGKTTADYLSPDIQARLEALKAGDRNPNWRTQSFVGLSFDLLEQAGFERSRSRGAADAVRRAARTAHVDGEPVGFVRGDELVDNLITQPPETYLPCLEASIRAAEAGPAGAAARLDAWRSLKVTEVLATPLDQALNLCWPSGDPEIAPVLRGQWADATKLALTRSGVTMGVAPLRILAEPGGVLDQLEAQGLEIHGPVWREDQR